jgi:hypothetical protein
MSTKKKRAPKARKMRVEAPPGLLDMAQQARRSLASSWACGQLAAMRGRVRFSRTVAELKGDR